MATWRIAVWFFAGIVLIGVFILDVVTREGVPWYMWLNLVVGVLAIALGVQGLRSRR